MTGEEDGLSSVQLAVEIDAAISMVWRCKEVKLGMGANGLRHCLFEDRKDKNSERPKIVNEIVKRTKRPLQSAPHNGNFPPGDVRVHAGPRQRHSKRRMISGTLIAPPAPYIRSDLRPKDLHAYGWPKRSMPTSYDIQKIHQVRGRR